ncbi:hypothetical protein BD779DRAFT_1703820 [Infundibulicybe gibba]|nr:hypothetical protein BD779DRAFT_1703820 [Infundibulicybe gibba]
MPKHYTHSPDTHILHYTTRGRAEEWAHLAREDPPLSPGVFVPDRVVADASACRKHQPKSLARESVMCGGVKQAPPSNPSISSTFVQYTPSCNLDGSRYPPMPHKVVAPKTQPPPRGPRRPVPRMPALLAPATPATGTGLPIAKKKPLQNPREVALHVPVPTRPTTPAPSATTATTIIHALSRKLQKKAAPSNPAPKRRIRYALLPNRGHDEPAARTSPSAKPELSTPQARLVSGSLIQWRRLGENIFLGVFLCVLPNTSRDKEAKEMGQGEARGRGRHREGGRSKRDHEERHSRRPAKDYGGKRRGGKREKDSRRHRERERRSERRRSRSGERRRRS